MRSSQIRARSTRSWSSPTCLCRSLHQQHVTQCRSLVPPPKLYTTRSTCPLQRWSNLKSSRSKPLALQLTQTNVWANIRTQVRIYTTPSKKQRLPRPRPCLLPQLSNAKQTNLQTTTLIALGRSRTRTLLSINTQICPLCLRRTNKPIKGTFCSGQKNSIHSLVSLWLKNKKWGSDLRKQNWSKH